MDLPLTEEELAAAQRRFVRVLLGVVAAYFLCVTLFRGEFWPFSRFPMFSRGARPWTRAMLRELTPEELQKPLLETGEKELPGATVPLYPLQKNQDDISTVVGKIKDGMSAEQQQFIADYFAEARATRHMVLYAVRGTSRPDGSVRVRYRPLALLGPEGVQAVPPPPAAPPPSPTEQPAPPPASPPPTGAPAP